MIFINSAHPDLIKLAPGSVIKQLFDNQIIKSIADIYRIKNEDLEGLEGFGEKSINNLINSIEKSKSQPLSRIIHGLGIPHVGIEISWVLPTHGETKFFGGGGGSGYYTGGPPVDGGTGGNGGGGNGGASPTAAADGMASTGGGAGGMEASGSTQYRGGSGVIIIRYAI